MGVFYYCNECNAITETMIIEKEQTLNVKGKNIALNVSVRVCATCGEEILDEELDAETLDKFYKQYRKLENLLMPEEIKAIRQKYQLSQVSFAKFLGFGEKSITRYENGAIQDTCHDNLIRLMNSIDTFALLWKERKDCLSIREQTYIDSILSNYNKTKINSTYTFTPIYYSNLSNVCCYTQGEMSYAG